MARLSATMNPDHAEMYSTAVELVKTAAESTHLQRHRTEWRERVMRGEITGWNHWPIKDPRQVAAETGEAKEYFRRLKRKYLAQEEKRSFLYQITGDEPTPVRPGEIEELEQTWLAKKAKVKTIKKDVETMRVEALALSRENAEVHAKLVTDTAEVSALHKAISEMELELARLKGTHPPEKRMTTDQAIARLEEQTSEIQRLTDEIGAADAASDTLREKVSLKTKEVKRLEREREREEARADEVRKQREAGGNGTRAHELGMWYASSLAAYRALLGIRDARAISDSELLIEYNAGGKKRGVVELVLFFDENRQLADARVSGAEIDLEAPLQKAVDMNDAPGLVTFVLARIRPLQSQ